MTEPRMRRRASAVYMVASIAAALGLLAGFIVAFEKMHGAASTLPVGLGAFAITLAIAGWIHERDSRWKTWRSLGLGTGAVMVEPVFAAYPYAGYVVLAVAVLFVLTFFFGDLDFL